MSKAGFVVFIILVLVGVSALAAPNKNFYSDGTIEAGQEWNMVAIADTPPAHTTVSMTGGTVWSVGVFDTSTFNFLGGTITGSVSSDSQSTVNISSSGVSVATAYSNSILNISGNANLSNVSGSSSSTINVFDGTIGWVGGSGSTINLYGGDITMYLGASAANTVVNVFGTNLVKTNSGGILGGGFVSGRWNDGTAFSFDISPGTYAHVNLVPEPVTLLLLGCGTIALRARRS